MAEAVSKLKNKYKALAETTRLMALADDENFLPIYASSKAKI